MLFIENDRASLVCLGLLSVLVLAVNGWWATSARADALAPGEIDGVYIRSMKSDHPDSIRLAIGKLEGALEAYPNPALLQVRIGMLYLKTKDTQRARARFRDALVRDSTLVAARYGLGRVYLELMNNPRRALRNLERAIRIDSTYVGRPSADGTRTLENGQKRGSGWPRPRTALRHDPGPCAFVYAAGRLLSFAGEHAVKPSGIFRSSFRTNPTMRNRRSTSRCIF